MVEPLNPQLFRLLELHFDEVGIVSEGQNIQWRTIGRRINERAYGENRRWSGKRIVDHSGEEYKIRCPFCRDHRQRLFINHRWGVLDEETGGYNLFLCQCFNEQCVDSWDKQKQLADMVFSAATERRMRIRPGRNAPTSVTEVKPPGPVISLDQLSERYPHHPAVLYLRGRQLDPAYLAKRYGVSYCPQSRYPQAQNRIICPMYQHDRLVGWQARYIGDDVPSGVVKYWSCPGMARKLLAYNFEAAVKHHTIPIVEGPTDVWNIGPMSLGLIGKTMNPSLVNRFVEAIKNNGSGQVVPIVLDPEQSEMERRKGTKHHIDKLYEQLHPILGDRVFPLFLPIGYDPGSGSIDRDFLRSIIVREAAKRGLKAKFVRPVHD